jgi:general secretion pathway protein K
MMRVSERGAALLSVLLLVAVMAVIAATALDRLTLATRLAGAAASIDQARAYAYAGEALVLRRAGDIAQSRDDAWLARDYPLPLPGGRATGRLSDATNCFNLNALVAETGPGRYTQRPLAVQQFAALARLAGIFIGVAGRRRQRLSRDDADLSARQHADGRCQRTKGRARRDGGALCPAETADLRVAGGRPCAGQCQYIARHRSRAGGGIVERIADRGAGAFGAGRASA